MKFCVIAIIAVGLVLGISIICEAGVVNTQHDMVHMGKGTDPNVCGYCHVPHNAVGDKMWSDWTNEAQLNSGPSSQIGNMCYTCHDGTVTTIGQTTVFNTALQQHKTGVGTDCNICHNVHDNTHGKFLGIEKTQSTKTESATYCETCHDSTMYSGAERYGDHLAGSQHPYRDAGSMLDKSCNSCHQMHGAVNYTTTELTHPILKMDNTNSAYCAFCHSAWVQNTVGGRKHPANLASSGTWGRLDCETCHDPHQPDESARPSLLLDDNLNSGYCMSCHSTTDTTDGPTVGIHSHPVGESFVTKGLTPSGNAIDDDDDGVDYPDNSSTIVCESCHSIHHKGVDHPLLRITADSGKLCVNCHNDK